jgi:hypothetical protein
MKKEKERGEVARETLDRFLEYHAQGYAGLLSQAA